MSDELWRESALGLAELIRTGKVSSREVIDAHLARIEEVNPHLNAVVRVLAEGARAAADAADEAIADGRPLGALHGVPFTVKENIDLAGTPTTSAVVALAEAIAPIDAPQVARLRYAGAIPIGRTNLPDLGLRVHTHSSLHGLTRNPWNPHRTAGGSSGGEAAALATGMSPLGLGNDLGGSLRNPAHCCGIASIKPSTGSVPGATVIPPEDLSLAFQLMAVEGVMARRVADVRAGFNAVAGQHPRDPLSVPARFTDLAPGERLRIAVMAEPPGGSTHPGIAAVVRAAADALSDAGHDLVEATPPDYERALDLWGRLLGGGHPGPEAAHRLDHGRGWRDVPHPRHEPSRGGGPGRGVHGTHGALQPGAAVEPVARRLPGPALSGVDAAGVPARVRHRELRERRRHARTDATGAAGEPARHAGRPWCPPAWRTDCRSAYR